MKKTGLLFICLLLVSTTLLSGCSGSRKIKYASVKEKYGWKDNIQLCIEKYLENDFIEDKCNAMGLFDCNFDGTPELVAMSYYEYDIKYTFIDIVTHEKVCKLVKMWDQENFNLKFCQDTETGKFFFMDKATSHTLPNVTVTRTDKFTKEDVEEAEYLYIYMEDVRWLNSRRCFLEIKTVDEKDTKNNTVEYAFGDTEVDYNEYQTEYFEELGDEDRYKVLEETKLVAFEITDYEDGYDKWFAQEIAKKLISSDQEFIIKH